MTDNNKPGFTFGTPGAPGATLFSSTPATTAAARPMFGSPQSSLSFNPPASTGGAMPAFNFGGTAIPAAAPQGATSAPAPTAAPTGFTFPNASAAPAAAPAPLTATSSATPATASGFSLGTSTAAPPAFSGFKMPTTTPASTSGGSLPSFGAPVVSAATTTSTGLGASAPAAVAAPATTAQLTNLSTGTVTTQSAAVTAAAPSSQLNFCQLEEYINKWTLELEEQEKVFTNQATQINAWDRVLIENGEKILALNEAVDNVKAEQKALETHLEHITAQHTDLDECIKPLEAEMSKSIQVDSEREQTYLLAESLDTQMKQMGEDLKEVIEHLNEANKDRDPNDPVVQIGKILNAHMSSLQWIESTTTGITNKLDNISKMQDTLKRDNDRSFRLN